MNEFPAFQTIHLFLDKPFIAAKSLETLQVVGLFKHVLTEMER
jgi:hypothetical protein